MLKRLLALFLAFAMVLSMCPVQAFATEAEEPEENEAVAVDFEDEETVDGGSCGDGVNWVLTQDGTLIISGQGEMEDYQSSYAPWYDYYEEIYAIVIEDGVESIGTSAFYECSEADSVTIPDTVTSIGNAAFECCYSLESIDIPDSVTSMGNSVFYDCENLQSVELGSGITEISP